MRGSLPTDPIERYNALMDRLRQYGVPDQMLNDLDEAVGHRVARAEDDLINTLNQEACFRLARGTNKTELVIAFPKESA